MIRDTPGYLPATVVTPGLTDTPGALLLFSPAES